MFFAGSMPPLTVILTSNFIGHGPLPKRDGPASRTNLLKSRASQVPLAGQREFTAPYPAKTRRSANAGFMLDQCHTR